MTAIAKIDRATFFAQIRKSLFGKLSVGQVSGLERLLAAWETFGDAVSPVADEMLAYVLSTSKRETGGRMQPVRETYADSTAQAISRLEAAWKAGKLTWVKTPYWRAGWFGRGDVQLTHEENYKGDLRTAVLNTFGVDIHANPDAVLRPDISAFVLIEGMTRGLTNKADFTKYALEDFIKPGSIDFENARKVVNPGDKDTYKPMAEDAKKFLAAIKAARAATAAKAPTVVLPETAPVPTPKPDRYAKLYTGGPHDELRNIQVQLRTAGFPEVGETDGRYGNRTANAIMGFRRINGLPISDRIDDALLAALALGKKQEVSQARAETTAKKMVEMGDETVKKGLNIAELGKWAALLAPLIGVTNGVLTVEEIPDRINDAKMLFATLMPVAPWIAVSVGGYVAWKYGRSIVRNAVEEYRNGRKL